jgi:hypothetical protein
VERRVLEIGDLRFEISKGCGGNAKRDAGYKMQDAEKGIWRAFSP